MLFQFRSWLFDQTCIDFYYKFNWDKFLWIESSGRRMQILKLDFLTILQKRYWYHYSGIQRNSIFCWNTLSWKNWYKLLKTGIEWSNIGKSCRSDFQVLKSVSFFQCNILFDWNDQYNNVNTNSLALFAMLHDQY